MSDPGSPLPPPLLVLPGLRLPAGLAAQVARLQAAGGIVIAPGPPPAPAVPGATPPLPAAGTVGPPAPGGGRYLVQTFGASNRRARRAAKAPQGRHRRAGR